mgnify:CR=1 FL=1
MFDTINRKELLSACIAWPAAVIEARCLEAVGCFSLVECHILRIRWAVMAIDTIGDCLDC